MAINVKKDGNNATVSYSGRLDTTTSGDFQKALNQVISESIDSLTVDLRDTDFISSKGIRVLVAAKKEMGEKNVTIINANPAVTEIIRNLGLLRLFGMN